MKIVSIENKKNELKMNVKPKFFKVMKQKIFTLVMMLALVIVAGSAFGQTKFTPYAGGTYSYTIPIDLANNGSATLVLSNAADIDYTLVAPASLAAILSSVTEVDFTLGFQTDVAAGPRTITFTLTDGTSTCSNVIVAIIDIQEAPALDLTIAASIVNTCQNRNADPDDNVAETVGAAQNSFTFTVTPDITGAPTDYTYTYDIDITDIAGALTAYDVVYSGAGGAGAYVGDENGGTVTLDEAAGETTGVFTVTWTTTTGAATQNIEATLSNGNLLDNTGGGNYAATYTDADDDVDVRAVPGISPIN
jgi:hypothetical protein